ncbi:MAG: NapC/NirT family cytochrome c [Anaerolineales bacterium]|jgi:nitrate/TMAO reductase-like tetraheme cytochrome c subunit
MLRRFGSKLKSFFFPPTDAPLSRRILPYAALGVVTLLFLIAAAYGWDYTNSPEFCGTACHTMPPEFNAYLISPHARVDCVECHIGRGFIATRITRKAGDMKHIFATMFKTYEFPIEAGELRPARETCERCHFPEKFSADTLVELKRFEPNIDNTPISIYLTLKTGGGSERQGLGRGIHWHIENPVYYYATDRAEQNIPYVQVVQDDGSVVEYLNLDANMNPENIRQDQLKEMDCITCHNRITHLVYPPEDTINQLMARQQISSEIPEIRLKAQEVYHLRYPTREQAVSGIAGLRDYYRVYYPEFFEANELLVDEAIEALQSAYLDSVFPEQRSDWKSHPDNVGHKDSPGCFRCHDGKHLNVEQEAIRLECNLCHSIPVVAGPDDFIAEVEISRGPEPQSHLNSNWITLHHEAFDESCQNCHTTGNPGGTDNSSFCSNSACHGNVWEYAGFDAPSLRDVLQDQLAELGPPVEETEEVELDLRDRPLNYSETVGPLLSANCSGCHDEGALAGLNVTTYSSLMEGGQDGPVIVPGDPDGSLIIQKLSGPTPHFAQLSDQELEFLRQWIEAGAPQE